MSNIILEFLIILQFLLADNVLTYIANLY